MTENNKPKWYTIVSGSFSFLILASSIGHASDVYEMYKKNPKAYHVVSLSEHKKQLIKKQLIQDTKRQRDQMRSHSFSYKQYKKTSGLDSVAKKSMKRAYKYRLKMNPLTKKYDLTIQMFENNTMVSQEKVVGYAPKIVGTLSDSFGFSVDSNVDTY
jgi:hypothetical protein